jgi:hypothetical protein
LTITVSASFEIDSPVTFQLDAAAPAIAIAVELTPNTTPKPFTDAIMFSKKPSFYFA